MQPQIDSVIEELKRLKQQGVEGVYIGDTTLSDLRLAMRSQGATAGNEPAVSPGENLVETGIPIAAKKRGQVADSLEDMVREAPVRAEAVQAKTRVDLNQQGKPIAPIPLDPPQVEIVEGNKETRWNALKEQVLNDPVCLQHLNPGAQVVFGVGSIDADIFFCGEAPGGDEEKLGEPFVGRAGELLTKIIVAMGLSREQVYIGNIMNWRPEMPTAVGNRPPTPVEMAYCLPYLRAQIEIVQPKLIVALGMTAVNGLLGPDPKRRMGDIRGQFFEFNETPLLVTYHPSYLLRYATMKTKRLVWEDMLLVMERIGLSVSEKQRGFFQ